jgi:hypothetical protein
LASFGEGFGHVLRGGEIVVGGDGRRRYRGDRERWIVERTVGWLGHYRRLVVRYERKVEMYRALVLIAFLLICLSAFLK